MPARNNEPEAIQVLSHLEEYADASYHLQELPIQHKLLIRGKASQLSNVFQKNLALKLPTAPYQAMAIDDNSTLFNMSPDEWLLRSTTTPLKLLDDLQALLANIHSSMVDVSDYYTVLQLESIASAEIGNDNNAKNSLARLLQKHSPFNFHPDNFAINQAVSTRYASCNIHVHAVEAHIFQLQTRWSHAEYIWNMLLNSAQSNNNTHY